MTRNDRPANQADTTIASGFESGIALVLFVGLGYALDAWLGTKPLFTLGLFVLGAIGLFYKFKAAYTLRMDAHDAERRQRDALRQRSTAQRSCGRGSTGEQP
jgi:F0F1-type ATP synthase assembly protein I